MDNAKDVTAYLRLPLWMKPVHLSYKYWHWHLENTINDLSLVPPCKPDKTNYPQTLIFSMEEKEKLLRYSKWRGLPINYVLKQAVRSCLFWNADLKPSPYRYYKNKGIEYGIQFTRSDWKYLQIFNHRFAKEPFTYVDLIRFCIRELPDTPPINTSRKNYRFIATDFKLDKGTWENMKRLAIQENISVQGVMTSLCFEFLRPFDSKDLMDMYLKGWADNDFSYVGIGQKDWADWKYPEN